MADISRRTLITRAALGGALVAGAGVGFTREVDHKVASPPPPAPDRLVAARTELDALLGAYTALQSGQPASLLPDVTAQRDAVDALLQRYPGWRWATARQSDAASSAAPTAAASTGSEPTPPVTTRAGQAQAITRALTQIRATCLGWPASEENAVEVVTVLASIAAGLSTQLAVLA